MGNVFMSMFEFNCVSWEGGNRFYNGNCLECYSGYALNHRDKCKLLPTNCDVWDETLACTTCSSGYVLDTYGDCYIPSCGAAYTWDLTSETCLRNCANGVFNSASNTCTCDNWKELQDAGCFCAASTPVEGTYSCSAPSQSDIVVRHTTSVDGFGWDYDFSSDT